MADSVSADERRPSLRDAAKFTAMASLLAIFYDASLGHGLTWENDPYWTYWITKTFLIATIFGLGTVWFGMGAGRGAVITGVHTLVLTIYYWTFSPVGLPSHPEWLDLEHTWISGLPIHFGVIYLGYLTALWLWRRRARMLEVTDGARADGVAALMLGVGLVVVVGLLSWVALGEFPGVTWFLVRVLITIPFLLAWWAVAGRDRTAAVTGGVLLALLWATYAHFLGPSGLPDTPLRIVDPSAPPADVRWLDYTELWLISFPIYLVVAIAGVLADSLRAGRRGPAVRVPAAGLVPVLAVPLVLLTTGLTVDPSDRGTSATIRASGDVQVEAGDFYSDRFEEGSGSITVHATDQGGRVTPLPPHDRLSIEATVETDDATIEVDVDRPMVDDPLGRHGTWWGVGFDVDHHGRSGIGTSALPNIRSELAAFGLGEVRVDGSTVARGVRVHVMTASSGLPGGATLELDVGDPDIGDIEGLPEGHLRVLWATYEGGVPEGAEGVRYALGVAIIAALVLAALALARRERGV